MSCRISNRWYTRCLGIWLAGWLAGPVLADDPPGQLPMQPARTVEFTTAEGTWLSLDISPDGKTVAFMSNRDGNWEIYAIGSDGRNLQRLTDDPGNDGLPTWSPDGKLLAFVTNRDGEWAIWGMQPDGRQKRQLFPLNGSIDGIVQVDVAHAFGWLEERIVWSK